MTRNEEKKIRTGRRFSLIVPIIVAVILSFGNDYIVLRSIHDKNQIDLASLENGLAISNICLLTGLVLAIVISNLLFRIIIRQELMVPLQKIRTGMNRIRHGDYDYRIEHEENDLMYELYDDFNEMAVETKRFAVKEKQIEWRKKRQSFFVKNVVLRRRSGRASVRGAMNGTRWQKLPPPAGEKLEAQGVSVCRRAGRPKSTKSRHSRSAANSPA